MFKWRTYLLLVILPVFVLTGCSCKLFPSSTEKLITKNVQLNYWRVDDSSGKNLQTIVDDYRSNHPQVSFKFKNVRAEELEWEVLRACAAHQCPDIVSVPVGQWRSLIDFLSPLPDKVQVPYITIEGWKKDRVVNMPDPKTLTVNQLGELFVDAVKKDVVSDNKIYGLPLSLDTIIMYYNRDLLNKANIAEPAVDWTAFRDQVSEISLVNKQGQFIQNGTALGEADNIPLAFELVSTLMMQNGTPMANIQNTKATFDQEITAGGETFIPGEDALRFYLDFSNPTKKVYSWSAEAGDPFNSFVSGRLAYHFDYMSQLKKIKTAAPRLNIGLANFPQIGVDSQPVYYANYNIETVLKDSGAKQEAWDFLMFAATRTEENAKYLSTTGQLTALRKQVDKQKEDYELGVGAKQLLNSRTWYYGYDQAAARQNFLSMIRQVKSGTPILDALNLAARQVSSTYVKLK